MLNRDLHDIDFDTPTAETTHTPVVQQPTANTLTAQAAATGLSALFGKFQRELGDGLLPAEATTSCTIISGQIKMGADMNMNAGDYLTIDPLNITKYEKLNLGIPNPSQDEKKLQVNCYDGQTVLFDEQQYSKSEFLELVKSKGFSKAKYQDRAVVHGFYIDCERADKVELVEDDRLMAIYLSPSSLKALQGFVMKTSLRPQADKPLLKLGKEDRTYNGTTWTQFNYERVAAPESASTASAA
ncbi:hypothetical protein CRG49_002055 [Neisseria sp. N95_16]|uniref:Uncharacterized protein n=1 Tax=Neisseria brasiliensis TaxID=2666100 RepID=A0A7X2GYY6_9NEIS|nr:MULTISPECIES: hypothetical protein [Neisseria]MRN38571.1 hypothetical protein [Neisseria brasiliensis]PJO10488.1 hypothetical protein CRG49_002055 [Neisseria sp. N95_16]